MIRDYFNAKAGDWDTYASERDSNKLQWMAKRLDLKSDIIVLDIGTGTGVFLPYISKFLGKKGQVIALDIADKMLLQAKNKGIAGKIDYLCADVQDIPLKDETFDVAVCYSSFPHFQNKPGALKEIRRVLKKGGHVFICHTSGRDEINKIHITMPLLQHDMLPEGSIMKSLLQKSGFTAISVEDSADSYFAHGQRPLKVGVLD